MKKPIRILHVLTAMEYAGTETLLMRLYRNIDRTKIQFDFAVSSTKECAYDSEIRELGGLIIHYPKYTGLNHNRYMKWWKNFLQQHTEYRIIHGHIGSTASLYLGIAKKLGRYTIAHSHNTNENLSLHSVLYKIYSYPTRYIADYYFGCSRQAIIDRYGKTIANNPSKSRVLNNALDTEKYIFNQTVREKIRNELQIPLNTLVIGTVGRLSNQKNPFEIVRICEELRNRGLDFMFLWFGNGELKDEIAKSLAEKELNSIVKLCGTRSDIHNVLQAFDIFLFPSVYEGLGIAGVEAQASGLPTLCSDTLTDEAKATDLCITLKLNDTQLWCDKIQECAIEIQRSDYQRKNTRDSIISAGYDIKEVADWLENFYLERAHK